MPRNLETCCGSLERIGFDAVKIAADCRSLRDGLRVLHLARGRRNVVAVPMGEIGSPLRVLASRYGSALSYAAVEQTTARGQPTLKEMAELYRADRISSRTRVYGLIGNPVRHSLSPEMHNAGFAIRGINAVYLKFLVPKLEDFLQVIAGLQVRGFSVTLPHKEEILSQLSACGPLARQIGAVNTVIVKSGGRLIGYNTDYMGVLRPLEKRISLRRQRILIYGAGGAARTAAFGLASAGAEVIICARRYQKAQALSRAAGGEAIRRAALRKTRFDAIVNATPVGMYPQMDRSPLLAAELNCNLVFDLVYNPRRTRLLHLAAGCGIETISGVEMFVAQGIAQWELWMGEPAPRRAMQHAVLQALQRQEIAARKTVGGRLPRESSAGKPVEISP